MCAHLQAEFLSLILTIIISIIAAVEVGLAAVAALPVQEMILPQLAAMPTTADSIRGRWNKQWSVIDPQALSHQKHPRQSTSGEDCLW